MGVEWLFTRSLESCPAVIISICLFYKKKEVPQAYGIKTGKFGKFQKNNGLLGRTS